MAKNAVADWDVAPSNNTDIAGINIAEGCPAAGINDAIRTVMAQIAAWIVTAAGPLLKSGGTMTGNIDTANHLVTNMHAGSSINDPVFGSPRSIGYRAFPFTGSTTGRTLALADVGMCIPATGTINIPTNASVSFAVGDAVGVYNNSAGNISITATAGVTLRLGGSSTTGNRTLAQRGLATIVKVATDEWVALNGGVS
jgi:hypothetical protein